MKHAMLAATATFVIAAATLCGGCRSTPQVITALGPRSPTQVAEVEIYKTPPQRYEVLGTVTAGRDEGAVWGGKGDVNAGFDALIRKAAALGANGLLLSANPQQFDSRELAGYHGKFYEVPVFGEPPVAVARAIYVLKK